MESSGVLTGRCVQIGRCVCVREVPFCVFGMDTLAFPEVTNIAVLWLCKPFLHVIEKVIKDLRFFLKNKQKHQGDLFIGELFFINVSCFVLIFVLWKCYAKCIISIYYFVHVRY